MTDLKEQIAKWLSNHYGMVHWDDADDSFRDIYRSEAGDFLRAFPEIQEEKKLLKTNTASYSGNYICPHCDKNF